MSRIFLIGNTVSISTYGHLQLVYDPDQIDGNGNELEIEVQSPNIFATGDWDVSPVQPVNVPGSLSDWHAVELTLSYGRSADDVWDLLSSARDFIATQGIDYRLGLIGGLEGQNSNTYITTMAHIAGLEIDDGIQAILDQSNITSLPGVARNVLFTHHAPNNNLLDPISLVLTGTAGGDVINGGNGLDVLSGGGSDDLLQGFGGVDVLNGDGGRDYLFGGDDNDTLNGGDDKDRLNGDDGDDVLNGEHGNDTLNGGNDQDTLNGGLGRDKLNGGAGDDDLSGDEGWDTLRGDEGDDTLSGGRGKDDLAGGQDEDRLFGNGGDDAMSGGADADRLNGGGGADELSGDGGDDFLYGARGNDMLLGGAGADVFAFTGTIDEGQDTISDFEDGIDVIRVKSLSFADLSISGTTDAVVVLDGLTEITLTGISATDLDASDFIFA